MIRGRTCSKLLATVLICRSDRLHRLDPIALEHGSSAAHTRVVSLLRSLVHVRKFELDDLVIAIVLIVLRLVRPGGRSVRSFIVLMGRIFGSRGLI